MLLPLTPSGETVGTLAGTSADWVWLAIALPFLGFLVNGTLAFVKPKAKLAVSLVGAGVLLAAFALAVAAKVFSSDKDDRTAYDFAHGFYNGEDACLVLDVFIGQAGNPFCTQFADIVLLLHCNLQNRN